MKILVQFELPDGVPIEHFGDAEGHPCNSLHEALCQAIHEEGASSEAAILWLNDHVADIKLG